MGISELRQLDAQSLNSAGALDDLGLDLVRAGSISRADAALAQLVQNHCDASLEKVLETEGLADPADLIVAQARRAKTDVIGTAELSVGAAALPGVDPRLLIKHAAVPVTRAGGGTGPGGGLAGCAARARRDVARKHFAPAGCHCTSARHSEPGGEPQSRGVDTGGASPRARG